jgi:hypothetical protein
MLNESQFVILSDRQNSGATYRKQKGYVAHTRQLGSRNGSQYGRGCQGLGVLIPKCGSAQGVAIFCGNSEFLVQRFNGSGCHANACVGMLGRRSRSTLLVSMATPNPARNTGVPQSVAMAPPNSAKKSSQTPLGVIGSSRPHADYLNTRRPIASMSLTWLLADRPIDPRIANAALRV